MILWTIKLFNTVRQAIAGRRHPAQLAWAVAFGCLLGLIPHGNLLAVGVLLLVMSLKLNHAMAALTTIGVTFVATRLDPLSHRVGEFLLTEPNGSQIASKIWALPMVPWTNLHNTVVLGSFTIGLAALLPLFLVTYPIFRLLAPADEKLDDDRDLETTPTVSGQNHSANHSAGTTEVIRIDQGTAGVPAPQRDRVPVAKSEAIEFQEIAATETMVGSVSRHIETKIDVIRMRQPNAALPYAQRAGDTAADSDDHQPMDEALNYLLRQLRDSQQRNAA